MKGGQVLSEETWKKSGKKCVTEDDPALKSSYYVYVCTRCRMQAGIVPIPFGLYFFLDVDVKVGCCSLRGPY